MTLSVAIRMMLLILLIICSIAVNLNRNLLQAVIIFMSYSSIMCIVWILLESPDLAITEAAVGAGISGTLFLMTLKKISAEDAGELRDEKTGMLLTGAPRDEMEVFLVEENGEGTTVLLSGEKDPDAPVLMAREEQSRNTDVPVSRTGRDSGEVNGHEAERMEE